MNKSWKKFNKLSEECCKAMESGKSGTEIWDRTFEAFTEAVRIQKELTPDFTDDFYEMEDKLDYKIDVEGWLEDYLDELTVGNMNDKVIEVCSRIISMFKWEKDSPAEFRFQIAGALGSQGKYEEVWQYCSEWYRAEPDHILAAAAYVYAGLGVKRLPEAEEVIQRYIDDDTRCDDENDIMFTAAETFYRVAGNSEKLERIRKRMEEYEEELEDFYSCKDEDGLDFMFEEDDSELPFK